ncbi:enoyl-ACP reductase FabI [Limosilactobacillus gastricus]|uniref:Enoyl-[acyl-carrier-protein] reductase [NADH] n=1 Tax=Limosilactobacillus gastricus DSM 16045 TaxID=1423749 RepID=A0A0R1VE02_9LACO|nr:enoyl-ACP reductase FabI [Limosilactobacillus gastricus]KRM03722.1 Enoyl-[acyl-carrier protein] reductase [Limosilactobacillus gastricus DSM 16045]QGF39904.1 enoyl-ACP reductase FabI [Limosilactobacillus gastricus]
MSGILENKKIVIMGVANKRSIAWGCAKVMAEQGAELIYTYNRDRTLKSIKKLVDDDNRLIQCDASDEASIQAAFNTILDRFGKVDGIVHSIAFANQEDLGGEIMDVTEEGYNLAQDVSAYSLIAVARNGRKILNDPASIVAMSYFGAERAIPNYNVMGVAKAALEANVRYLARDMGKYGVRVNAISAGAIKTLAVTGVQGHKDLLRMSQERTVDGKDATQEEVGGTCAFLMSDLSTGVVGDVIYVDKGVHLI